MFNVRMYADLSDSVSNLRAKASQFKFDLFKSFINGDPLSKTVCSSFLSDISTFITDWKLYSDTVKKEMHDCTPKVGINVIDYDDIKDYVYASYDYASILPYLDGLMKLNDDMDDEDLVNKLKAIDDFTISTLNKAFDCEAESVAELLDNVNYTSDSIHFNRVNATNSDLGKFKSVASYSKLFDNNDRNEIIKSFTKVIEYIYTNFYEMNSNISIHKSTYASIVNHIVEYMMFTATIYAVRIFVIGKYAIGFIRYNGNQQSPSYVSESADIDTNFDNIEISIMRLADDKIYKDMNNADKLYLLTKDFVSMVGLSSNADKQNRVANDLSSFYAYSKDNFSNNSFLAKLVYNPLIEILSTEYVDIGDRFYNRSIKEKNQLLNEYLFNNNGLPTNNTPKQEILHVIKGDDSCDEKHDLSYYQDLAFDLHIFNSAIIKKICNLVSSCMEARNTIKCRMDGPGNIEAYPYPLYKISEEMIKNLREFYNDFVSAILARFRDIEMHVNELKNAKNAELKDSFNLNLVKGTKPSTENNMAIAIPDTLRSPMTDITSSYAIPTYENLQLYDEYLRSIPGMENSLYLSEAFSLSDIINKIISLIEAAQRNFMNFINNVKFKAAVKWVTDNENNIMGRNYDVLTLNNVKNYKENIRFPNGFNNFARTLNSFDAKILNDQNSMDDFITKLYPDPKIAEWFKNDSDKIAANAYKNLFLFTDNLDDAYKNAKNGYAQISLDGATIRKYLPDWINTIKKANKIYNAYVKILNSIRTSINSFKSKLSSLSKDDVKTQPSIPNPTNGNNSNADNNSNNSNNSQNSNQSNNAKPTATVTQPTNANNQNGNNSPANSIAAFSNNVMTVYMNIVNPLTGYIAGYMSDVYEYIKVANNNAPAAVQNSQR